MTPLSTWLRAQMKERGLNQTALTARAGIAAGTVNDILRKGHIPKIETLFRLADALEVSHIDIMLVTGHLRRGDTLPGVPTAPPDHDAESNMEWRLIEEFRRIPRDLRPDALAAFQTIARLVKRPRFNLIGEEDSAEDLPALSPQKP